MTKRESLPSPNPRKIPLHLLLWLAIMPITHPRQWPGACSTPPGLSSSCQRCKRCRFDPWVRKNPWSRKCQPTPVFLPGKSHVQRSLVGYSPWDRKSQRLNHHQPPPTFLSFNFLIDRVELKHPHWIIVSIK